MTSTCPSCGAPLPGPTTTERTCAYCHAVVPAEAPPRIVQQVTSEVIERVVVVEAATQRTSLRCPRCDVPIFEGKAGSMLVHGCGRCGGVWLDNQASRRLVEAIHVPLLEMTLRAAKVPHGEVDLTGPARCPVDQKELERVTVKGIEVDVCAAHGTWFDAGEANRVAVAFNVERIESAAGATYDYDSAAEKARANERYAQGAAAVFRAILADLSRRES